MGGGGGGFMSTRGAGDLLTRTTWILAGLFFFMCLTLTVCSGQLKSNGSVVDRLKNAPATVPPPPVKAPGGFDAPKPEVQPTPAPDPFGNLTGAKPLNPAPEGSGAKKPH